MAIVYKANRIEGLSSDTKPADQYNGRIFYETDTSKSFSFDGSTWNEIGGSGSEFNIFTSSGTFTPSKQTGLAVVDIDTTNMPKGQLDLVVDGNVDTSLVANETLNKFVNPSSSLALTTKQANYAYGDFASSSSYNFINAGGYTQYTWEYPKGQWWNDDGTKFYYVGLLTSPNTWHVFENSVSSANAWLFTTANDTYNGKSSALPTTPFQSYYAGVSGLKDGGTKMYFIDKVNNNSSTGNAVIYRFDWSTAYDATTCATTASNTWTVNDFSGQDIGMGWNNDGTKLFIYNGGNSTMYRYSLSTAWDLSTESLDSGQTKTGVTNSSAFRGGFEFNSEGTRLYTKTHPQGGYVTYYTYSLSTAWDVTTISSAPISTFNTQGNGGQYGSGNYYNDHFMSGGNGLYDWHRYQSNNGYIHTIHESYDGTAYASVF